MKATGWTERWIRSLVAEGEIQSRPSGSHGLNHKPLREYLLSSLPAEAQIRYANLQAEKALTSLTAGAPLTEASGLGAATSQRELPLAYASAAAVADDAAAQA